MRLRHGQLEDARKNPKAWVEAQGVAQGFVRLGYDGATKLAINDFHKHAEDSAALSYLQNLLARNKLTSPQRGAAAEFTLKGYIAWYQKAQPIVANSKVRLELDLGHEVILGGEVSRVDVLVEEDGYAAILLGDYELATWKDQLRMPLIQKAVGLKFERNPRDVRVGVQRLDGSDLRTVRFSAASLDDAEAEARKLAKTIAKLTDS